MDGREYEEAFPTDLLELMRTFVRIVEAGSITAAAAHLRTTQPTVSRRLKALEDALGMALFQRSTHVLKPTAAGERCYTLAKGMLSDWTLLLANLRGSAVQPTGTLRVRVSRLAGPGFFAGPLAEYGVRCPQVRIEWAQSDGPVNLLAEGLDCAIVAAAVPEPSAVAIRLVDVPRVLVAEARMAARVGDAPEALERLPWLALRGFDENALRLARTGRKAGVDLKLRARLASDDPETLRDAALNGLGASACPEWLVRADLAAGRLVRLLPAWQVAPLTLQLVYRAAPHLPPRLLHFVEVIRRARPMPAGRRAVR